MRKYILSIFIISRITSGLYFTQKSSAAVSTTLANSGTPLSAINNYTWQYPTNISCTTSSGFVPFAAYTFDITVSGNYTFTMDTEGFTVAIHVYKIQHNPNDPCVNMYNNTENGGDVITGETTTIPLNFSIGLNRWVAVFSASAPGGAGTFSASVSGPAAVTPVAPSALASTASRPINP